METFAGAGCCSGVETRINELKTVGDSRLLEVNPTEAVWLAGGSRKVRYQELAHLPFDNFETRR